MFQRCEFSPADDKKKQKTKPASGSERLRNPVSNIWWNEILEKKML